MVPFPGVSGAKFGEGRVEGRAGGHSPGALSLSAADPSEHRAEGLGRAPGWFPS